MIRAFMLCCVVCLSNPAWAARNATICVFDVMAAAGDTVSLVRDFSLAAKVWNVDFVTRVYTDEKDVQRAYNNKECQAMVLPDFSVRNYNHLMGSFSAVGSIQNDQMATTMIRALSSPKAAHLMIEKQHEVAGIIPLGSVFVMNNNRQLTKLSDVVGKRFMALENDPVYLRMIEAFGAKPVLVNLAKYGAVFSSGGADIIAAPAALYQPFELYRGIGSTGAAVRYPILYLSLSLVIDPKAFPVGFGQNSRDWFVGQLPRLMGNIKKIEQQIPEQVWQDITAEEKVAYGKLMREMRRRFVAEGIYNSRMLAIVQRTQCALDALHYNCDAQARTTTK